MRKEIGMHDLHKVVSGMIVRAMNTPQFHLATLACQFQAPHVQIFDGDTASIRGEQS